MQKNVGKTDAVIRIVAGICIIGTGIVYKTWWGAIGAGIMVPAILSSDPLYTLMGISTRKKTDQ